MPVGFEEIQKRFGYHKPNAENIAKHELIREAYMAFANLLDQVVPDGEAKKVAMRTLQNAAMWSNFAVAEQSPVILTDTPEVEITVRTSETVDGISVPPYAG